METSSMIEKRRQALIYECLNLGNNKKAEIEADKPIVKATESRMCQITQMFSFIKIREDKGKYGRFR